MFLLLGLTFNLTLLSFELTGTYRRNEKTSRGVSKETLHSEMGRAGSNYPIVTQVEEAHRIAR